MRNFPTTKTNVLGLEFTRPIRNQKRPYNFFLIDSVKHCIGNLIFCFIRLGGLLEKNCKKIILSNLFNFSNMEFRKSISIDINNKLYLRTAKLQVLASFLLENKVSCASQDRWNLNEPSKRFEVILNHWWGCKEYKNFQKII